MAFPLTSVLTSFPGADQDPITDPMSTPFIGTGDGQMALISNQLTNATGGGTDTSAFWNKAQFSDGPAEGFVTLATASAVTGDQVKVSLMNDDAVSTMDGYEVHFEKAAGTDIVQIKRRDNAVPTTIATLTPQEIASGDSVGISIIAGVISAYYKASAGSWTLVGSTTDTTYPGPWWLGVKTVQASPLAWKLDDLGGGIIQTGAVSPFPLTLVDDFNRADNASLGANWLEAVNGKTNRVLIQSNQLTVTGTGSSSMAAYIAGPTGLTMACQMDVVSTSFSTTDMLGLGVTCAADTTKGYHTEFDLTTTDLVVAFINDSTGATVGTVTATGFGQLQIGDQMGLVVRDNGVYTTLEQWIGRSGAWTRVAAVGGTGTRYLAGPYYPAMRIKYDTEFLDNFAASNLTGTLTPIAFLSAIG